MKAVSLYRRRLTVAIVAVVVVAVIAFVLFRPDRVAELHEVSPEIASQVRAAIPANIEVPGKVSIRFRESSDGSLYIRKQFAELVAPSILRRSSTLYNAVNEAGAIEESTSLSIGPVALVRHFRQPPPFAGALLPNYFWHTRTLRRFEVKPGSRYPGAPGESFEAMLWTEIRYTTGEVREIDQTRLICTAGERMPARNVHASFAGDAIKVRCEESGAPVAALTAALAGMWSESELKSANHIVTSESWFVESLGMAIQINSQESIKIGSEAAEGNLTKIRTIENVEVKRK